VGWKSGGWSTGRSCVIRALHHHVLAGQRLMRPTFRLFKTNPFSYRTFYIAPSVRPSVSSHLKRIHLPHPTQPQPQPVRVRCNTPPIAIYIYIYIYTYACIYSSCGRLWLLIKRAQQTTGKFKRVLGPRAHGRAYFSCGNIAAGIRIDAYAGSSVL
jgi:hypothetical protein